MHGFDLDNRVRVIGRVQLNLAMHVLKLKPQTFQVISGVHLSCSSVILAVDFFIDG